MTAADSWNKPPESSRQWRCIVITGASSGLGAALAHAYAAPGRMLGLVGRNPERLADVAKSCQAHGATVRTAVLDVADAGALSDWLLTLDTEHPIDLLIANAGISAGTSPDGRFEGIEAARTVVTVNLLGVINCVEPLLPRMMQRRHSQIAVVASMAAYRGLPDSPSYCASKAGVLAYGESLRTALEPVGVRVSVIIPGFFASPMSSRYVGRKLFLLTEAQAVARVIRGLDHKARRIVFPRRLALLLRLADLLPAWCSDRIIRAFRFQITQGRRIIGVKNRINRIIRIGTEFDCHVPLRRQTFYDRSEHPVDPHHLLADRLVVQPPARHRQHWQDVRLEPRRSNPLVANWQNPSASGRGETNDLSQVAVDPGAAGKAEYRARF